MKMKCRECRSPLHSKLNHENVYLVEPCEMCLEKLNAEIRYKEELLREKNGEDYDVGYSEGYPEGYDLGYSEGHSKGCDEGFEQGYDEGFEEGREEGYDEGFNAGKKNNI